MMQFGEIWETRVDKAKEVLWGLKVAMELGVRRAVVESDYLPVIQAMCGKAQGLSNFHLIIADVLELVLALIVFCGPSLSKMGIRYPMRLPITNHGTLATFIGNYSCVDLIHNNISVDPKSIISYIGHLLFI